MWTCVFDSCAVREVGGLVCEMGGDVRVGEES